MPDNLNTLELSVLSKNLDIINTNVELGSAQAVNILDSSTFKISEVSPDETPKKLAGFNEKIKKLAEIVEKFSEYANYIKTLNLSSLKNLPEKDTKSIKNKIALLSLKIKKTSIWIQLELTKIKRSLLILSTDMKIAPALAVLFAPIIIAIQLIFSVITTIIAILDKILLLIPFLFALAAEGMAFFLTPKSVKTTNMTILNTNTSVSRIIPTPVITAINEVLNIPLYTMGTNKQVAMAASASASMTAALDMNSDESIITVDANISYAARDAILSAITIILAVLPLVEPLPKYERLPMWKNLGYFLWLLTGWCPAGKMSFGLPGLP